jgi:hypothetical protein
LISRRAEAAGLGGTAPAGECGAVDIVVWLSRVCAAAGRAAR